MYTLDTNAVIYYLQKDEAVRAVIEPMLEAGAVHVATVTEIELFSYTHLTLDDNNRIEKLLDAFEIVPLDSNIARIAGRLRREQRMKLPDSVIAATALFTGTTLVTRNIRDFKRIPNLSVEKI